MLTNLESLSEQKTDWLSVIDRTNPRTLAIVTFLAGVAVAVAYRPWNQIEVGDPAVYDYIAQSILRGQIPYRDIVDIKGPGGAYLSALAMLIGKAIGLRDIIAVRMINVMFIGLLSMVTFQVARIYLRNRLAGLIAALAPLMPEHYTMMMIGGTQPKLPMILFGMLTLLLIAKDKPFWAGVCSMMSCLCWQPGLMFTGTAVLIFSAYLTRWRDLRALKVMIGAVIPLVVVLSYFYWKGALGDLWAWTITYNYGVFGPEAKQSAGGAIGKLWKIIARVFRPGTSIAADSLIGRFNSRFEPLAGLASLAMIPASIVGMLLFAFERVREKLASRQAFKSPKLFRDALIIPPLVYFVFCLINFQAGPDLIPFFPFIGIFAAWFFVKAGQIIASRSGRINLPVSPEKWPALTALLVVLIVLSARAITYRLGGWTLQYQDSELQTLSKLLEPDDKIYVHGTVELLVLLNRPNLNPYVLLDWDADNFAGARTPGGWNAIMDEMESQQPKLVAISRLRTVKHRADLEKWVQEHYEQVELFRYERVFIRKKP